MYTIRSLTIINNNFEKKKIQHDQNIYELFAKIL